MAASFFVHSQDAVSSRNPHRCRHQTVDVGFYGTRIEARPDAPEHPWPDAWSMHGAVTQPSIELRLSFTQPSRRRVAAMGAIELVMGIAAVLGGLGLLRDGSGLEVAWIEHTLLPSWTIPGILLIVLVGGGMLTAAAVTLRVRALAAPAALAMGLVLLAWLAIETLMIGWHGGPQLPLDILCGGLAAALVGLALPSTNVGR
jgi:hypothetical protein